MKFDIIYMATVSSTNRYAKEHLHKLPEGSVIWADQQTNGYGRRGDAWESLPGNLMFSLVLWPEKSLLELTQLSFIAGSAVSAVVAPLLLQGVILSYKWPNDVLLNGHKFCGILLETEMLANKLYPAIILGIGINIASAPDIDKPTTALNMHVIRTLTPELVLTEVLKEFQRRYECWLDK